MKCFVKKKLIIYRAKKIKIKLTKIHWKIIYYFMKFYIKNKILPSIKNLLTYLNINNKNYTYSSIFLFTLFPKGIFKQICKLCNLSTSLISCF